MTSTPLKAILHLVVCILLTFVVIYSLIFAGGWKLLESSDIILTEIFSSIIIGSVIWIMFELSRTYDKKINTLEARITELEKQLCEKE